MPLDTLLPLSRAIPLRDPIDALRALQSLPHPFLLHSALEDDRARWSFFGADPFAVFRGADYDAGIREWRALRAQVRADEAPPGVVPFTGGAVGYWAYDFGRRLERWPTRAADDHGLPDVALGLYDVVGAYDHHARQAWLFSSGLPRTGDARHGHADARLDKFSWIFDSHATQAPWRSSAWGRERMASAPGGRGGAAASTFHPDDYRRAVERVREHIARGDIFQANLTQRWTLPLGAERPDARARDLFEAAAGASPAPYAAYLGMGDHAIASASPERFLEVRGRHVETRPIKGTRARGRDWEEDQALRAELLASEKDRAENVMIVDVLRNDLGRVCDSGSVRTTGLCELEVFPQVLHLTSTVRGRLQETRDAIDLLHACFPGGSITGAPKLRAIEIIDSLEPVRRHAYTGAIGYLDWSGDADFNIAIRTAIVTPRAVHFAAGGGITADSEPEAEYRESLQKIEGLRAALSACLGPVSLEPGAVHAR